MRSGGILLHISSLPGEYGIGSLGAEAFKFVDFLEKAGQKYWQVLPLGPTSYGDSPYQTFSAFGGNPYFIDLNLLIEEGLLTPGDCQPLAAAPADKVDYAHQYRHRVPVLKKAFQRFSADAGFEKFKKKHRHWLDDYALFMAIKSLKPEADWSKWDYPYRIRSKKALADFLNEREDEVEFWKFVQHMFFRQWFRLKAYANERGIKIIGDMPIYVSYDSADVWSQPEYWLLDERRCPEVVAGVPPDLYSETGQLWGNPIYDYEAMESDGFSWWIRRIKNALEMFDVVRIDHFRGFESFYTVRADARDAREGRWFKGPGYKLFARVKEELGEAEIIAEDLGFMTPEVHELREACGFPGMKILQFGFDHKTDSEYAPHNYTRNAVVYPGTHDNSTLRGWLKTLSKEDYKYFCKYMQVRGRGRRAVRRAISACLGSICRLAIIPIQDYLFLDDRARFNCPSTLGGNWVWRLRPKALSDKLAARIRGLTELYRR
ncbi:MAG: 4-alpha-glucanotransferase [Bacillota bacterium]|nr:4-alpha-glucanotransferase [Bacillota bacterium]